MKLIVMPENLFGEFVGDPFLRQTVTSANDLDTIVLMDTHHILEFNVKYNIGRPFQILLKGKRGIGKTLAIVYARELIKNQKDPKIIIFNTTGLDASFSSLAVFLQRISRFMEDPPQVSTDIDIGKNFYQTGEIIDKFLGEYRVVVLIDIPDLESRGKHFDALAKTLENLFYSQRISIIMAVNPEQYEKFNGISTLLTKFNPITLLDFNREETRKLIGLRLAKYSENNGRKKTDIKPFTKNSVNIIHKISGGIPRNIINSCEKIFSSAHKEHLPTINESFAEKTLRKKYVESVLEDRIKDERTREQLYNVYSLLKKEFNGTCTGMSSFHEKIRKSFGWTDSTIRRRIEELRTCNIIKIIRDEGRMNTKIIKVVI